jgi:hypothetical protein
MPKKKTIKKKLKGRKNVNKKISTKRKKIRKKKKALKTNKKNHVVSKKKSESQEQKKLTGKSLKNNLQQKKQNKNLSKKKKENKKQTKKIVQKQSKPIIKEIFPFNNKRNFIITIFAAFLGTLFLYPSINSNINFVHIKTNIFNTSAKEAFQISSDFDIIETEKLNRGHYIAPGDMNIDVFSFGIQAKSKKITLKELTLKKLGEIDDSKLLNVKIWEGEKMLCEGIVKKGKIYFKNINSNIEAKDYKQYLIKLDIAKDAVPATRFKFAIENPKDISIYKDGEKGYWIDTYPLEGAYVTIVGKR